MGETILRSEAIAEINRGHSFDLEFVTCDRHRGTGGDLIAVKRWMKLRDDIDIKDAPSGYTKEFAPKKDMANHRNKTFKIFNPANKHVHPITVRYRLMQTLNGKSIING